MRTCAHKVPTVPTLSYNLRSENDKVRKVEKVTKIDEGLHPNHMHIFRPWRKHVQSLKKIGIKLYEEYRSQGTRCPYTEVKK